LEHYYSEHHVKDIRA